MITNCPVTVKDIKVAHKIWGKSLVSLKGKMTCTKPLPVAVNNFIKVLTKLLSLHKEVYLTANLFFVNKIPFFLTLSHKIQFTVVNHLANQKVISLFKAFMEIYQFYLCHGFQITVVSLDGKFELIHAQIEAIPGSPRVNLTSANEHVPEIECHIRVVKEQVQSIIHGLPYARIPMLLLIWIVFSLVKMLNFFPSKAGVLDVYSPCTIMTSEQLNFKKHLSLQVGQYCQVHDQETPCNMLNDDVGSW